MSDLLGLQTIVKNRDIPSFYRIMQLLDDMVWMMNNFIAHSNENSKTHRYHQMDQGD